MNSWDSYVSQFLTLNNPILYSSVFAVLMVGFVILAFVKVIMPMRFRFFKEKQNILLEQAKLMALFSELDPDPSLRCSINGDIIQTNDASRILFGIRNFEGKKINELLKGITKNISDIIGSNEELSFLEEIKNKIFLVNIRGNSSYNFAHVYMNDITRLREYEIELEDYKEKLRTLAEKLENNFEKQRKQFSAELHDDIGQKMVLLKMKINQLNLEDEKDIFRDVEQIYTRIRDLSHMLKPAEIDELGLKYSMQTLVNKVSGDSKLEGYFSYLGPEEKFDPDLELCLYRIAQEAVTNILKHAEANEFSIQLMNKENQIELLISDDGKGIPQEYFKSKDLKNYGIGLFGMKERLNNFNGTIKINSAPMEGTNIIVKVPKLNSDK
jgi:signal transduction histidine kinase